MRKNYFQDVKIADKLKMIMKAIFAILLVNNILFAILMLVFGHPVWIIISVIAVVGMPLLSKKIIQELTQNILEPLDQIEKAADDMAHGNLEIDISYQGEDELGKLAESFRNTSFYLRGVVDDINQLLTEFAKGNFDARSHDIEAYQGNFGVEMLDSCLGLDYRLYDNGNVRYDGGISFMKSGILYADKVTTVSPTYSQEILTPQFGEHLEMVLNIRKYDLWGITNGIDIEYWDPKSDPDIPYHYNKVNVKKQKKRITALQK